jgi:MFS family permease
MPGTSSPPTAQRDGRVAGWINIVVASLAMTATLPGRTHGLGLVNEQVLTDLHLSRSDLADINFWTSLIGALFAAPAGFLIDRCGVRRVLLVVTAALGAVVWGMSQTTSDSGLFVWLVAIRGLGQSALSVRTSPHPGLATSGCGPPSCRRRSGSAWQGRRCLIWSGRP